MYWNIGPRAVPAPAAPAAPALSYSERMQARRAARSSRRPGGPEVLSPAEFDARTGPIGPFKGDRRSDGKFYTGEAYGWQTAPAAARSGLLGSEVLGDAAFARSPGPSAGGGQAPITSTVTPLLRNSGTGNAAVALQNAAQGVKAQPSWNWSAPENAQVLAAAQGAGEAAQAARAAQGGRGYLSGGATPDPSNPASQAFWDRADTQAWEAANPQLAAQLKAKHGFGSQAAPLGFDPGAQTGLDVDPQAQSFAPDANAPAVPGLVESLQARQGLSGGFSPAQTAFSEPTAPTGSDPVQRMAPNQMRSGPETEVDLAQALNTEHLQSIKAALRGNENLTSPSYFQPSDQYQQPSWPWGQR